MCVSIILTIFYKTGLKPNLFWLERLAFGLCVSQSLDYSHTPFTDSHEVWDQRTWYRGKATYMYWLLYFLFIFKITAVVWYF